MFSLNTRKALAVPVLLALCACESSQPSGTLALKAETVLPPGQSGFYSNDGQAAGQASGQPGDYGAHVDDQRLLYWNFDAKPATLGGRPGTPEIPKSGIEIYRDGYGVPIVYANTTLDLWFGVGYAIAQDRLFLMDAVRRTGAGTLSELTGCGDVAADIRQRTSLYTDAEFEQMFAAMSQESKDFIQGYVDGANAWLAVVQANPSLLPAEYTLLSTTPAAFTVRDALAAGVYITRFVAAEGGNEFQNIRMIQELETEYGSRAAALDAFLDMTWLDDPKAVTSVPAGERTFSNQLMPQGGRDGTFRELANWALNLPPTLWKGEGTGNAAAVGPCAAPAVAKSMRRTPALADAGVPRRGRDARPLLASARKAGKVRELLRSLSPFGKSGGGHSFGLAIGPQLTRDGGTLLVSAPQLGYSYPLLLVEYEIHGAGYDARGVSVPILPTVGIGYTDYAAWALTTGYSKTIDSFVETTCSTAQQAAGTCQANQYFHKGSWKDMDCRTETIFYRSRDPNGVPFGPPDLSQNYQVCRTIHGPIVARDDNAGLARSLQFAMFNRELETIEGIREWNRAKTFGAFLAGIRKVTWNENVMFATRDGHFGYVHPGLFRRRAAATDMRLPIPGEGAHDFGGYLGFDELPQVIDPAQGFVANWNTKPAAGWLDGEGLGSTSRPGGAGQRVTNILDLLGSRNRWTFADLRDIDIHAGTKDVRAREYLPVIADFRANAQLSTIEYAVLDRMLAWDQKHYDAGIDIEDPAATDGPGATLFGEYVDALREELFGTLKDNILDPGIPDGDPNNPDPSAGLTVFGRVAGVGSHKFDQSVMDNLVLRVLNPSSSGLPLLRDYTGGRSRNAVMQAALTTTLQRLSGQYNGGDPLSVADLDKCRRVHPRSTICSLTGVIGPGSATTGECVTMPYQDRGSWVHRVGYENE